MSCVTGRTSLSRSTFAESIETHHVFSCACWLWTRLKTACPKSENGYHRGSRNPSASRSSEQVPKKLSIFSCLVSVRFRTQSGRSFHTGRRSRPGQMEERQHLLRHQTPPSPSHTPGYNSRPAHFVSPQCCFSGKARARKRASASRQRALLLNTFHPK